MSGALEAAQLGFGFGLTGADEPVRNLPISDCTVFVPEDAAFEAVGSVVAAADPQTLREVLRYRLVPNHVVFSPSRGSATVQSLQGADLTFTVLPDGSAWVNNARITFPNTILYNGVAHAIDRLVHYPRLAMRL